MSNRNFYMIHVDLQETSKKNAADQRRKVQIFVLQQKVHMRKEKKITHKLNEAIYKMQSQNFVWQYSDEKEKKIHCRKHFLQRQRGLYHILLISRYKKRKKNTSQIQWRQFSSFKTNTPYD